VSQRRPSRRATAVEPEQEAPPPRGRQAWIAVGVTAVLIVAVGGSGWLVQKVIEPATPPELAGCATSTQIAPHQYIGRQPMCITAGEKLEASIHTDHGDIVIQLAPEVAPVTVNNFVVLAVHGYYNGLDFWKAEDWVVQGGDPLGSGRGGPGYNLPDETTVTPWAPGAVGMARVPGGPVNGSQFFIQKAAWPAPGPTAAYNRFGTVVQGMDIVQAIATTDKINSVTVKVS
jgi:cyclophilin family peptidyl-prolyl cis-trans isomerase